MSESPNPQQPFQKVFSNVSVGGDLTAGDITLIYNQYTNLDVIPKPQGIPQNIISSSTDKFVGRERDLENLNQQLQRHNQVVIAAVEGMGGVGKTELAIQYSLLNLQLKTYPGGICWIHAREQDIGLQIVNFARTDLDLNPPDDLELPDRVRWCWKRWQEGNTLIVLDDVNDYSEIKPYLPPQPSQFKVLITTRLKLDLPSSLYLAVLSEPDALELLSQLVGSAKVEQELETAKELCQRLGYLPLALQLVGRYIKKRRISLAEELRRLEEKGLGHPSMEVPENDPSWTLEIKRGVEAAFELSWDELKKFEFAQELGCLLSLFALAPIPWTLVESAVPYREPESLENDRTELENLHLLQGEDVYQLHQLIREFLNKKQINLAIADEQKKYLCQALVKIAQHIPETPTIELIKSVKDAIPHLEEVAQNLIVSVRDEDLIWVFSGVEKFYSGQGLYAQAETWCKQCLLVVQTRLGAKHPDLATSLNNLAELYRSQGRYTEAEPLYLQALYLRKRSLGEEHPDLAISLNSLALLYYAQGRYTEAELLFQQVLDLRKRLLEEEHPDLAISLNNLAAFYRSQGRYAEAEPLYLQALDLRKRLLGESHPDLAISLNNLALLYESQGRYVEAEPLYLQALELYKRLLGEEHPDVAFILNNLAKLYYAQGRYAEAEPYCRQALDLRKRLLGEEHPDVALSLNNLAELYRSQGRYTEAEPYCRQALDLRKRLLGEEHPDVAFSLNNLAKLYSDQKQYEQAKPLYRQALEIAEKSLGVNHPTTITIRENLKSLGDDNP
ncbi:NB-ARC domain-containing protein [Stanieria sp. NIES-3757]|nr:NB-ARC domain-containing protein [Stanieria sp. NIES-3757]